MPRQNISINFNDGREPNTAFKLFEKIIEDRGSKYSVSIARVTEKDDIQSFLKTLKTNKKYAKADHNSWAVRMRHQESIYEGKNDDGEAGAGAIILRILQKENLINTIVCVTRWFGGTKLMGDRFKHIQDATKYAIDAL